MLATLLITVVVWIPLHLALQVEELKSTDAQAAEKAEAPSQQTPANQAQPPQADKPQPAEGDPEAEAANGPSKRPNTGQEGIRRPFQDDILKNLLNDREAAETIPRQDPGMPAQRAALFDGHREMSGVMPDGTPIVERPGRYYRNGDQRLIELRLASGDRRISFELLPNALLEALEREAATGVTQFTVSGELTRYGSQNYLLLRKVVQRVDNGNLAP